MIKLIVCDLDGTLLNDQKEVDSGIFPLLDTLKEKGISFSVISGRNERLLAHYVDELDIDKPYATNNGANMYVRHKCIGNDCIVQDYNNTIARILYDNRIAFRIYSLEGIYAYENTPFFESRGKFYKASDITAYNREMDLSNIDIYKIACDFEFHQDVFEKVSKEILDSCKEIAYSRAEGNVYCVNSISATKANALKQICERLGISVSEAMAFGDNDNDVMMLKTAGVGVAMSNSDDEVKNVADHVCGDNNHNGVSEFIKKYFDL